MFAGRVLHATGVKLTSIPEGIELDALSHIVDQRSLIGTTEMVVFVGVELDAFFDGELVPKAEDFRHVVI